MPKMLSFLCVPPLNNVMVVVVVAVIAVFVFVWRTVGGMLWYHVSHITAGGKKEETLNLEHVIMIYRTQNTFLSSFAALFIIYEFQHQT